MHLLHLWGSVFAWLLLIVLVGGAAVAIIGFVFALLEQVQDIPALLIEVDLLAPQVLVEFLLLLLDGLTTPVYLLENNLDEVGLAPAQHLHFAQMLLASCLHQLSVMLAWLEGTRLLSDSKSTRSRCWLLRCGISEAMHDPVCVLVLPLVQVALHLAWIEGLQAVRLELEAIVEVLNMLDVVMDSLGPLLLHSEKAAAIGWWRYLLLNSSFGVGLCWKDLAHREWIVLNGQEVRMWPWRNEGSCMPQS